MLVELVEGNLGSHPLKIAVVVYKFMIIELTCGCIDGCGIKYMIANAA